MGKRSAVRDHPVRVRVHQAWTDRPFTMVLSIALTIPGVLGLIYGDDVSAALSHLAAVYVSRAMGAALLIGGITTLTGIARGRTLIETSGMVILAAGTALYGVGVILGLGLGGMVSGPIALAVSLSFVRRVITLASVRHHPQ